MKHLTPPPRWLFGAVLVGIPTTSFASVSSVPPKVPSVSAAQVHLISWLPSAPVTQHDVFEYITSKVDDINGDRAYALKQPYESQPIAPADYPKTGTTVWAMQRYRAAPNDPAAYYTLVYQDLMFAHQLLDTNDLSNRRQGMRLAKNAQLCVLNTLNDKRLYARISEGFLLPYLPSAYAEKWQDLSRQQIVEGAYGAYGGIGETSKQIALLRFYLNMTSAQAADRNNADWARDQLAQALAGRGQYAEAIHTLQAIQTPDFAIKQMIPAYQQQLDKQKQEQGQKKPGMRRKPAASAKDSRAKK